MDGNTRCTATSHGYLQAMLVRAKISLTLAAFLMAAGSAMADEPGAGAILPPIEAPDGKADPVADESGERAESAQDGHLAALFADLSDPANENWAQTQFQIERIWKKSGSPAMDLLAERADKAIRGKDFETALGFLDDLVRLSPDFAEGWKMRATAHFMREEYRPALEDLARTLTLEPRHFEAIAGLGLMLDRLGEKKGALEAYRRAHKIHPHLPGIADGIRKLSREIEGNRA